MWRLQAGKEPRGGAGFLSEKETETERDTTHMIRNWQRAETHT